jgi:hypothetical protein
MSIVSWVTRTTLTVLLSISCAYFAFTTVLRVGDEVLRGCAFQGNPSSAR